MRSLAMLALTQVSNYLNLKGSFSAVSKRNVASEYAQFLFQNRFQKLPIVCQIIIRYLRKIVKLIFVKFRLDLS